MCQSPFSRQKSYTDNSKHRLFFCGRKCKDAAQRLVEGLQSLWPPHYGTGTGGYRNYVDRSRCIGCGDTRAFLILVHHIDGDRRNWRRKNLEPVCFNCHAIRHLRLVNGTWTYDSNALTPRKLIPRFMEHTGIEPVTFDLQSRRSPN